MDYLGFKKKLARIQDLIGTLEKALEHLKNNWLDQENFKKQRSNLVGQKQEKWERPV
jgi:chromosome segregation ATPase